MPQKLKARDRRGPQPNLLVRVKISGHLEKNTLLVGRYKNTAECFRFVPVRIY